MELKTDEANLCADSSTTGEMDLYDELVAFSNLSPEDQKAGPAPRSARDSEPTLQPTDGFILADLNHPDTSISEPVQEIQSLEPMNQPSFELTDQAKSQPVKASSINPLEDFSFELPDEPARRMAHETSSARPQPDQSNQGSDADLDLAYLLRVTGPLVALGSTMYAASSLLVCRDCRSQSSSEDMFCVVCGGLLDEADSSEAAVENVAQGLTCNDCEYLIEEDEIFCPSCGAAI
jgi:RNA polymerase subunit RPABC4/transcription elongation factor Spt4